MSFGWNGSSTLARNRRTITSTTFVFVAKLMSQTWLAISAREITWPAERTRWVRSRNSFAVRLSGVPARVDHTDDAAVAAFFGGLERLDLLVANAWGGYENYDREGFTAPFWEQPIDRLDVMFRTGPRAQFTAARAAAPLLRASRHRPRGRRAAKQRDELATPDASCHLIHPA